MTSFESFGLPEKMNLALARMNYTEATPIQAQAIPFALQGRDVLASAQTGTGKTAAFSIPMIARLMNDPQAMALVLTPTRELASQILDVVHKLTSNNRDIRTALLIGGDSMGKQFGQLRERPRLIVGTPGRINDHLRRDPKLLSKVAFVAIDEADRMLDMGFSVQIDEILATLPKDRQTVMFSATFPDSIIKFSRNYLNNPERVSVSPQQVSASNIKHEVVRTPDSEKYTKLLGELTAREGSVIIFVKTQHGTDRLAKRLSGDDHEAVAIHGGLRQNQRERAVAAFRAKRFRVLVATDVASRGLDIPHIEHVINYDLPQVAEDYIHRIGRTARAGAQGNAMAFVGPSDGAKWNAINRLLNPGEKPVQFDGGRGNNRPDRGRNHGYNRDEGFLKPRSNGGFKKDGYKKAGGFGGNDRNREGRRDDQMKDRSYQDRPRDRVASGEGKPFVKFYNKDGGGHRQAPTDRNWNTKDGRSDNRQDYRSAQGDKRKGGYGGDRNGNVRSDEGFNDRNGNVRRNDRNHDRNGNVGHGGFKQDGARHNDGRKLSKPFGGERNHAHPDSNRSRSNRPEGFRPDERAEGKTGAKPKAAKPAATKKPFKFKEHSRKPGKLSLKDRAAS